MLSTIGPPEDSMSGAGDNAEQGPAPSLTPAQRQAVCYALEAIEWALRCFRQWSVLEKVH